LKLIKKEERHQAAKKKNMAPGLPPRTCAFMIGKSKMTANTTSQLPAVAIDTPLDGTTYDMYNQVIGPTLAPKAAINTKRPHITITYVT